MQRGEALRILGLKDGATEEDIKLAYRESAQILHPDHFNSNEKLMARATEQFKLLGEARDALLGKGSRRSSTAESQSDYSSSSNREGYAYGHSESAVLHARIVAIDGARINVISYIDNEEDSRKTGFILVAVGLLLSLFARRSPTFMALGSTALIWGIIKAGGSQMNIGNLKKRLKKLDEDKVQCQKELDKL